MVDVLKADLDRRFDRLAEQLEGKQVAVLTSRRQTVEIAEVLVWPRLKQYVTKSKRAILELFTIQKAERVEEPAGTIEVCRDPKDNFLLETAVAGTADAIVTGDKDLLVLHPFQRIDIISYEKSERRLTDL